MFEVYGKRIVQNQGFRDRLVEERLVPQRALP